MCASGFVIDRLDGIGDVGLLGRQPGVEGLALALLPSRQAKLVGPAPALRRVDDDVATTVPTTVGYAPQPSAWVTEKPVSPGAAPTRRRIELDELSEWVSERGNPGNERQILSADVLLPREILRGGLQLVDSPGVGGLESANFLATLSALSSAHAVLLVSDASQEYTEPELQFLRHAMRISPNVAAVLAKTDLYPEWRRIEEVFPPSARLSPTLDPPCDGASYLAWSFWRTLGRMGFRPDERFASSILGEERVRQYFTPTFQAPRFEPDGSFIPQSPPIEERMQRLFGMIE